MKKHQEKFLREFGSPDDHEKMIDDIVARHDAEGHGPDVPVSFPRQLSKNILMKPTSFEKLIQRGGSDEVSRFLRHATHITDDQLETIKKHTKYGQNSVYYNLRLGYDRDLPPSALRAVANAYPPRSEEDYSFFMKRDKTPDKNIVRELVAKSERPDLIDRSIDLQNSRFELPHDVISDILDKSLKMPHPHTFHGYCLEASQENLPHEIVKKAILHPSDSVKMRVDKRIDWSDPVSQDLVLHPDIHEDSKYRAVTSGKLSEHHLKELRKHLSQDDDWLGEKIDRQLKTRFNKETS